MQPQCVRNERVKERNTLACCPSTLHRFCLVEYYLYCTTSYEQKYRNTKLRKWKKDKKRKSQNAKYKNTHAVLCSCLMDYYPCCTRSCLQQPAPAPSEDTGRHFNALRIAHWASRIACCILCNTHCRLHIVQNALQLRALSHLFSENGWFQHCQYSQHCRGIFFFKSLETWMILKDQIYVDVVYVICIFVVVVYLRICVLPFLCLFFVYQSTC